MKYEGFELAILSPKKESRRERASEARPQFHKHSILTKWWWRIIHLRDAIVYHILKEKYKPCNGRVW